MSPIKQDNLSEAEIETASDLEPSGQEPADPCRPFCDGLVQEAR